MQKKALELAEKLRSVPRTEDDLLAAKMLESMSEVYDLAYELVNAKSHEYKNAVYAELESLFKGGVRNR